VEMQVYELAVWHYSPGYSAENVARIDYFVEMVKLYYFICRTARAGDP